VICLIASIIAFAAPTASSDDERSILVLDLVVEKGISLGEAKLLNQRLVAIVADSKRFSRVIGSSDMQAILSVEEQKSALGCGDDNCLAELGGALGARYLLVGGLGKLGSRLALNLKILDSENASVVNRRSTLVDSMDDMVNILSKELELLTLPLASSPKKASSTKALPPKPIKRSSSRRFSWLGLGLIAAGAGYFAAVYPDASKQAETHREAFNRATTTMDAQDPHYDFLDARARANGSISLGLSLAGAGIALNAWTWWRSN
jgi:hypothetical protein